MDPSTVSPRGTSTTSQHLGNRRNTLPTTSCLNTTSGVDRLPSLLLVCFPPGGHSRRPRHHGLNLASVTVDRGPIVSRPQDGTVQGLEPTCVGCGPLSAVDSWCALHRVSCIRTLLKQIVFSRLPKRVRRTLGASYFLWFTCRQLCKVERTSFTPVRLTVPLPSGFRPRHQIHIRIQASLPGA